MVGDVQALTALGIFFFVFFSVSFFFFFSIHSDSCMHALTAILLFFIMMCFGACDFVVVISQNNGVYGNLDKL